jgi:hypothetical protein
LQSDFHCEERQGREAKNGQQRTQEDSQTQKFLPAPCLANIGEPRQQTSIRERVSVCLGFPPVEPLLGFFFVSDAVAAWRFRGNAEGPEVAETPGVTAGAVEKVVSIAKNGERSAALLH